ncbi:disks large-associated protein 5-like [Daphnia carinata]|uniref:disks large-associated protein 5-like n=1 Tax=Daphnia carinata TaxID=120202 RepID=UPI00257E8F4F|nr:disks large-associated protein 5-like [Daphnia carinata]
MNRNGLYKMSGLRCANSAKARAQRIDEQNGNRRTARQAKNDAKRGLVEIDPNVLNASQKNSNVTAELTHQQKLQERLARLQIWRQEKIAAEEKAKATKKAPFLVPGVSKVNKAMVETIPSTSIKVANTRVTRSQTKKPVEPVKQWTITSNNSLPGKKQPNNEKKENEAPNNEKSFAPKGFVFTAPKEISVKAMEIQDAINVQNKDTCSKSGTPQRTMSSGAENEDIRISPLVVNHPWISTTRGSSSKKQRMSLEIFSNQEPLSSPILKKRSTSERKSVVELSNPDAVKFRALMASEGTRLTDLCNSYEQLLTSGDIPEEETGSVRTVIGQAHLLQRERFTQFAGLVNQFENKTGEKEITASDLEGFWEMIYLQVSDVDKKFEELEKLKESGWVRTEDVPEQNKKLKVTTKKKAPVARPAKSNMRALIAAARKKQLAEKSCGSPSIKRRSSLLMSPARTPGKRQSLRRSVLLNSAKKPVFIVTGIAPSDVEEPAKENDAVAVNVTPGRKKTYSRQTEQGIDSVSSEERLSVEFDTLKNDPESADCVTPLRVFRSPREIKPSNVQLQTGNDAPEVEENVFCSPRRSTRIRGLNNSKIVPMGRASLLPTNYLSPVTPSENLISFD